MCEILQMKDFIILEDDSLLPIEWFHGNHMKLDKEKRHLLISGPTHEFLREYTERSKIGKVKHKNILVFR